MAFVESPSVDEGIICANGQGTPPGLIGLKLDISPEITPRDTSFGTKIFTLLPTEIRTVSEAKTHIANFVLKTPSPFYFFVGDYRIRDEEQIAILSLINEPCRLVAVPLPRSALSSTPKAKSTEGAQGGSGKRVTFFYPDLTASPVQRLKEDGGNVSYTSHLDSNSLRTRTFVQTPKAMVSGDGDEDSAILPGGHDSVDESSSVERKKRRRRRHRSKKSKTTSDAADVEMVESTPPSETDANDVCDTETGNLQVQQNESNNASTFSGCKEGRGRMSHSLEVLNEETESEDEIGHSSGLQEKQFDFITPTMNGSRKRSDNSGPLKDTTRKRKKLSDSAFSSEGSFASSSSSPCSGSSESRARQRQDTPNVPRVIRNPRVFEAARKIIDTFTTDTRVAGHMNDAANGAADTNLRIKNVQTENSFNDDFATAELDYAVLDPIFSPETVKVGDKISFKVLQLDEKYNPSISPYKEGIVTEKIGTQFSVIYTKNDPVVRTGKLDLEDEENEESKAEILQFADFIEPKFIQRSEVGTGSEFPIHTPTLTAPNVI